MPLSIPQICQAKYPGEVEKLNITFLVREFDIVIKSWKVAGIPKPREADLLAEADEYEGIYKTIIFIQCSNKLIQNVIDATAQSREYDNGVCCASYMHSSNPIWAAEAQAFIMWRDSIFTYALNVYSDIETGHPIPTQDEFILGFPVMIWP